jgi:hypothetical protein
MGRFCSNPLLSIRLGKSLKSLSNTLSYILEPLSKKGASLLFYAAGWVNYVENSLNVGF